MTPQEKIKFCYDAAYCNYRRISLKARCSMAPRNCEFEARETVVLQTGKKITIYYCTLNPDVLAEPIKEVPITQPMFEWSAERAEVNETAEPKTSCRLSGG